MNVKTRLCSLSLSVLFMLFSTLLHGADCTWTGAAGDTLWTNQQNWVGNTVPSGNADQAIFPAGTPTACLVDASMSIKCISFSNTVTLTIAPSVNLYLDNAGLTTLVVAENSIIDGTGSISFSVDTGTDYADIQVLAGKTLTLASPITGANGYEKKGGDGLIILNNANSTYTGTTTIEQGTARVINNAAFGSNAAPTIVKSGAALDFWGTAADALQIGAEMVYAEGAGPDGNGALLNNGAFSQFWSMSYLTLTGPTTVGGSQRLDVRGANAASTFLNLNGCGITKKGSNQFGLTNTTATNDQNNAFIDITEGSVTLEEYATLSGGSDNEIIIRNGAYFDLWNIRNPVNWAFTLESGARINTRQGNTTNMNILAGPVTLNGTATLTSDGAYGDSFTGAISGTGPLVKNGNGDSITYLRNTNNSYTAGTIVSNGTLYATLPGVLPNYATDVSVFNSACLEVPIANAIATQPSWSNTEISNILNNGTPFKSITAAIGFDTAFGDADYDQPLPQISVRKFNANTLMLSGSGANLGNVRIYGGTLDLSPVSRYLGEQNINIGYSTSTADPLATLVVTNAAQITTYDRGREVANQPQVIIGDNGRGVMRVSDSAKVAARIVLGNAAAAVGAVYQTGGIVHNTCGGNWNDGWLGNAGYGYYRLSGGTFTNNGYSVIGRATSAVGVLQQTGGAFAFSNVYAGNYGLSRGGTGIAHLSGGTFFSSVTLWVGDQNENNTSGGYASLTVTDTAEATINGLVDLGNRNNMTAMLNLKGGVLNANRIWRANRTGTEALVNWNGGLFRENSVAQTVLFDGGVAGLYPEVTLYAGGAKVELPTSTMNLAVNTPLRAPALLGLVSIPVATPGAGYLGSPVVRITDGGGKGAAAFAHVDLASGTLTSIEVVSPGTGYTSTPTVTLVGGGATTAATLGTPVVALSASGGLTKLGAGLLALNATNTYTGTTEVREGTLRIGGNQAFSPLSSIHVTGGQLDLSGASLTNANIAATGGSIANGSLATDVLEKNGSGIFDLKAPITLSTAQPVQPLIPGLWEGRLAGNVNTTDANPKSGVQLTTRAVNGACGSGGSINGAYWPNDSTYVYTGYIWNRTASPVTWTFAENFDDKVRLIIDGVTLLNNDAWDAPTKGTITLNPGPHSFEARFGQGGGGAGGFSSSWWPNTSYSFGVDFQGRNEDVQSNYAVLTDPGDGSLFTLTKPENVAGAGLEESVINEGWNTTGAGTLVSTQLTTRAGNGLLAANTTYAGGLWNGNYHTWIYKGILWNRAANDVTWTWRFTFDDNVMLKIDNTVVRNVTLGEGVVLQNHTLTPGPHTIEIRFGDGTGSVGPASGLGGLTYDPLARSSTNPADYMLLLDSGDGSLLTTVIVPESIEPTRAVVNVNEGTLRAVKPEIGLWEGRIDSSFDRSSANPATSVQMTTRAANGSCGEYQYISGAYWPINSTYIYTGYIWNRTGNNVTWTFAENFDDSVFLRIDNITVLDNGEWNVLTKGTITLTPGPHTFDVRFGQGTGGAGGTSFPTGSSFAVDLQGRDSTDTSYYTVLTDPGDGSLFTRMLLDPLTTAGVLASASVNLAAGTTLDLNNEAQKVGEVAGIGVVSNGTLTADTALSPAGDAAIGALTLEGVTLSAGITYRLTVEGATSDSLLSSGALDLSGVTLVPATAAELTEPTYIIAHADGGFVGAKPAVSGFPSKYIISRQGNDLLLTSQYGTMLLFR